MTPKLYAPDRTTILGWLADAVICEVTEERNGIYELYLEIPIASEQYPLIENDCFIKAKPSENVADQLFRVYSVEKSMTGRTIDNKVVRLHQARGRDSGVIIAYAKNLRALKASISTEGTYTGLYPFAVLEEGLNKSAPIVP